MKLTHNIVFAGKYEAKNVISVEVLKSVAQISDRATISLPLKTYNVLYALPKELDYGATVSIALGYDGKNREEFNGYISQIKQGETIDIICEDGAFNLRKSIKNKEYKLAALGDLISDIVWQTPLKCVVSPKLSPLKYEKFTVKDVTAYGALSKIQEEFDIHIYVRKDILYANLKFELNEGSVSFDFSKNVEKVDLVYEQEDQKKVQVEVVGIDRKNKKLSVVVGDKEEAADKIKINRYNVMDEATLKAIGVEELKKWKFTGYKGSITTWLLPYCTYGMSAKITDRDYPDRNEKYYVEAVETNYSESGGFRKINLGLKL